MVHQRTTASAAPRGTTPATTSAAAGPPRPGVPALRLPHPLARRLAALARRGYPHEVCGLLIGRGDDDAGRAGDAGHGGRKAGDGDRGAGAVRVTRITAARNLATERLRDRYTLDPADFVRADEAARREGLDVVGVWHTHPDHPARPSPTDLEAAWPDYSYLILSVGAGGVADVRSWRLEGEGFVEQPIEECEP